MARSSSTAISRRARIGCSSQFNTLDLFAVPVYHSVSMVTRAAPRRRYAVTGWLAA